jgi:cardiolipin hydrolase
MNVVELEALLRQSLADGKLSGSERQSLMVWAEANIATDQDRSVARSRVFDVARTAVTGVEAGTIVNFLEAALKAIVPAIGASATASSVATFSPGDACLGLIVNHFHSVRHTADICVFTITDDRISEPLLAAFRRGVKIRIITDDEKAGDLGSDIPRFREAGIPVIVDDSPYHMHHKFAIFDGVRLLNGSYNWTRGAAEQNQENIIDTDDRTLVARFQKEFDAIWALWTHR